MELLKKETKISNAQKLGAAVGLGYGLYFAMKNKKEGLSFVGHTVVFGVIGVIASTMISEIIKNEY
jgi:hypothetical protein